MKLALKNDTKLHKDKVEKVLNKGPFYFVRFALIAQIIIVAIMFSCGAILKVIPEKSKFSIKYNIQKVFISDKYDNDNNSIIYCLEALNKNRYLSENNKIFIERYLIKEIEENKEFININKVAKRIETLRVNYNKKYFINEINNEIILNDYKEQNLDIAGKYNSFFNEINMYEQVDYYELENNYNELTYGFDEASKTAYFHELNHMLTKGVSNSSATTININTENSFSELINELFAREYYNEEISSGYDNQIKHMYVLAEILPEDVLRKYKFDNNEAILISGLLDIDNDLNKAFEFISIVKNNQEYRKIHDLYEYYYEKKSGKKLIDNMNILAYLYDSKILLEEERDAFEMFVGIGNNVDSIEIIPKGYFSKDYKKEYPNTLIKINNAYFKILK